MARDPSTLGAPQTPVLILGFFLPNLSSGTHAKVFSPYKFNKLNNTFIIVLFML
jgi:hypothetical protein